MDYKLHYDNLIKTRKLLNRKRSDGLYYENHHAIMKSMGGDNNKENLVLLTAREHFLAHWLLWMIHKNISMGLAFAAMCYFKNIKDLHKKFIPSSRSFAINREVASFANRGKANCNYIDFSEEDKIQIIELYVEKKLSLRKIAEILTKKLNRENKPLSKKKISQTLKILGIEIRTFSESASCRKISPEGRIKISNSRKEKNNMCGKSIFYFWNKSK